MQRELSGKSSSKLSREPQLPGLGHPSMHTATGSKASRVIPVSAVCPFSDHVTWVVAFSLGPLRSLSCHPWQPASATWLPGYPKQHGSATCSGEISQAARLPHGNTGPRHSSKGEGVHRAEAGPYPGLDKTSLHRDPDPLGVMCFSEQLQPWSPGFCASQLCCPSSQRMTFPQR